MTPPAARTAPADRVDVELCEDPDRFAALAEEWTALRTPGDGPFLSHEWLRAWWAAFPAPRPTAVLLHGRDGRLRAGAVVLRDARGRLRSAANAYSEEWDVVAADPLARAQLWGALADLTSSRLQLTGLPSRGASAEVVGEVLADRGYRVHVARGQSSPRLVLPQDWPTLLAGVSRNLRSQVSRYRKRLEREGRLVFRTSAGPGHLQDLERFLALEASGWKGGNGTAILQDPGAQELYTRFAATCDARGGLRLQLLELDGALVAADYTVVSSDGAYLLKTAYDERCAHLSPGLVLRAEALRSAVQEGLRSYDFLGGPDPYKVRWAPDLQTRLTVRAYRGPAGIPEYVWRHEVRRAARRAADRARAGVRAVASSASPRPRPEA